MISDVIGFHVFAGRMFFVNKMKIRFCHRFWWNWCYQFWPRQPARVQVHIVNYNRHCPIFNRVMRRDNIMAKYSVRCWWVRRRLASGVRFSFRNVQFAGRESRLRTEFGSKTVFGSVFAATATIPHDHQIILLLWYKRRWMNKYSPKRMF